MSFWGRLLAGLLSAATLFWLGIKFGHGPTMATGTVVGVSDGLIWAAAAAALSAVLGLSIAWPSLVSERLSTTKLPGIPVALLAAVVFLATLTTGLWIQHGAPLTDDEPAYLFAARLLSTGRTWEASTTFPEFFNRVFLINDGKVFTQYYLGWPALLAPWTIFNAEHLAGPFWAALEAILMLLVLVRQGVPRDTSIAATGLYFTTAFSLNLHAGLLAYGPTTSLILAALFSLQGLQTRSRGSAFLLGLCLSLATWVRPSSGVAAAVAMLPWILDLVRREGIKPLVPALPAPLFLGALFLWVNADLYGGLLHTGYGRYLEFEESRGYPSASADFGYPMEIVMERLSSVLGLLKSALICLERLATDGVWVTLPVLLLAPLSAGREARLWLLIAALLILPNIVIRDFGIDSFGPVHLYEASTLLWMAATLGLHNAITAAAARGTSVPTAAGFLIYLGLIGAATWTPLRSAHVYRMSEDVAAPIRLAEMLPGDLLAIYRPPFTPQVKNGPLFHFVFWPPIHDPRGTSKVLWARSSGDAAKDALFAAGYPDRRRLNLMYDGNGNPVLWDPQTGQSYQAQP